MQNMMPMQEAQPSSYVNADLLHMPVCQHVNAVLQKLLQRAVRVVRPTDDAANRVDKKVSSVFM